MEPFHLALLVAAFLCALVAGFLFAFAVVAMPGLRTLADGAFIQAFQAMDRVIQDNQPLFLLVWVGSVLALLAAAVLGFGALAGWERGVLLAAAASYLLGVQGPTITINIPLNNQIQAVDVAAMDAAAHQAVRAAFEPRWNRWNVVRTVVASGVTAVLLGLLLRL